VEPGQPPVGRVPVAAASPASRASHGSDLIRNLDLLVLLLALPVFILIDAPISGYLAAGGAWIVGRIGVDVAARRRREALQAGNRNAALGVTAFATLGRIWLVAGAILLVGLLDQRDAGLAAAVLSLALVTVSLASSFITHVVDPEAEGTLR
jgi:hypothetical protein